MDSNNHYYNMGSGISEQGDSSSTEEVESPRSVVSAAVGRRRLGGRLRRWRKNYVMDRFVMNNNNEDNNNKSNNNNKYYMHSQVLRVKEEELQIGEYLMGEFGIYNVNYVPDSHCYNLEDDVWSRFVLPASPLGTKRN